MFEIRLDDKLITSSNNWREAHIETIDFLSGNNSRTLKSLNERYENYTDEDLFYELESMTDKEITININFTVDVPVKVNQHILNN